MFVLISSTRAPARRLPTLGRSVSGLLLGKLALIGLLICIMSVACSSGAPQETAFPWPGPVGRRVASSLRASASSLRGSGVIALGRRAQRRGSRAMLRRVTRATRALLDLAAYVQNPLLQSHAPEGPAVTPGAARFSRETLYGQALVRESIVTSLGETPLSAAERARPLAFEPLVDYLARWKAAAATQLEAYRSVVKEETWGLHKRPGTFFQQIVLLYPHRRKDGGIELWVKIEFMPWAKLFARMPDEDGDGYPEIYARLRGAPLSVAALSRIASDYRGRLLSTQETHRWGNELASYWYPSHNTDVEPLGDAKVWPTATTDAAVRASLGLQKVDRPTLVIRGKPRGKVIYNVFCVDGVAPLAAKVAAKNPGERRDEALAAVPVAADLRLVTTLEAELRRHGGLKVWQPSDSAARRAVGEKAAWRRWVRSIAPLHRRIRRKLARRPKALQALLGSQGFLFFRKSLDFVVGGDLRAQPAGKDPAPTIIAFKDYLAGIGVDFLLVPVPTKSEVFPDRLRIGVPSPESGRALPLLDPYARKLLLELSRAGVEVVDLLPTFLAARKRRRPGQEPLYQPQDTHWTDRGLRLAARQIAERIKRYRWYPQLRRQAVAFTRKSTRFQRYGDLHSRLASREQARFRPQTLVGQRVIDPRSGKPYDDDPKSPIVMLGDSFTGVYQRTYCENAGVSAHVARQLQYPLDLVMSYGGGPNVRKKLLSRGAADLKRKRLVIWLFAARDFYNYWEDWAPLEVAR